MKEKILIACAAVAVLGFMYLKFAGNKPKYTLIYVGKAPVKVEVANTIGKQRKGLAGRESIGAEEGMLFVLGYPARHAFTMEGMKFPIDIIWIRDNKVISASTELKPPAPGTSPLIVRPDEQVDMALEVQSGWVYGHKIIPGDEIRESN